MTKVYVAGGLQNVDKVRQVQQVVRDLGGVINYDWTEHGSVEHLPAVWPAASAAEITAASTCDLLIVCLPGGRGTHAEIGLALGGKAKEVVITGPTGDFCLFYHTEKVRLLPLLSTADVSMALARCSEKQSVGPLNTLAKEAQRIATAHGFTEASPAEDIALMHSELSEALEDIRAGLPLNVLHYEEKQPTAKPYGVPSEMADVVIRVFHFCAKHGIDLDKVVSEKMAYNDSRPYKHGGKKL